MTSDRPTPITSGAVARLAGVSQSAVSRTFTPGASVSDRTRAKVTAAAAELGYQPNLIARSLITRRTRLIGLAVGSLENSFYAELTSALSIALQQEGYHVLLFAVADPHDIDAILIDVVNFRVDALLLATATLSSTIASHCRAAGIPAVLINRTTTDDLATATISGDNFRGGAEIASALVRSGHQRLAYLAGIADTSTNVERRAGFLETLAKHPEVIVETVPGDYLAETARQSVRALFRKGGFRPDGIFCANDAMAIAAIDVIRQELKLRVPDDVSVVGFDDSAPASWSGYGLTTYSQPVRAFATEAVKIVMSILAGDPYNKHSRVTGELIVRSSARFN